MTQNISHAVMQQRREPHDSLDDFPTPPWATRALCEHVIQWHIRRDDMTAWEPACNRGYMVRPLREYFCRVFATDIHDYGVAGFDGVLDFLFAGQSNEFFRPDWIITNPPFRLAEEFIARADEIAARGYAVLVRSAFLESVGRYENLFSKNPPSIIAQFSERVIMHKGTIRDPNKNYLDKNSGKMKKPSTATSYCWLVWIKGYRSPSQFNWIPPCRKALERVGDYD